MKTVVAYTLHGEDHTGYLIRKQGLFWFVTDADGNEIRIPAKAVDETWEEADESDPLTGLDGEPSTEELETGVEPPNTENIPSLADQAMTGPTIDEPGESITLAELCDTYGVVPRIARRQLRAAVKSGALAHDHRTGWVFPRTAVDDIMSIITTRKRG